jgi:hypothetical protein
VTDGCSATTESASGGPVTGGCTKSQDWTVTSTDGCLNSSQCIVHFTWTVTPPEVSTGSYGPVCDYAGNNSSRRFA